MLDTAADSVHETVGEGADTVRLTYAVASPTVIDLTSAYGGAIEHVQVRGAGLFNITGNAEDNDLTANASNNILDGGDGDDTLDGGAGLDTLIGGSGDDLLDGGAGIDSMTGGDGNDTYVIDGPRDQITELANEGTDTVQSLITYTLGANIENLTLMGTRAISGTGNALNNLLTGNSAANALTGGAGNDVIDGGGGNDTVNGGSDNDTLNGEAGDDQLAGDVGQDTVSGGLGDDHVTMLVTSGDVDVADGGDGNDTLVLTGLAGGTGLVTVDLSASDQVADIGGVADSLVQSHFEHLDASGLNAGGKITAIGSAGNNDLVGSNGADSLSGGGGNDTLNGGSGNDTLNGNAGNDVLIGGAGNDTLAGGAGNDRYVVDSVRDTITESLNSGTDLVESSVIYALSAHVEHLTLTGADSIDGTGNALNNIIIGNGWNNELLGLAGDDELNGGAGNDELTGGAGNDQLAGGAGNDLFIVGQGDGQDLIRDSGGADMLRYQTGINPLDLVISRVANDLRIAVHGASDQVTIQNWYAGAGSQIEAI